MVRHDQSAPKQRRQAQPGVAVTTLHPLIRRHLGHVDLRCTEVLRVEDNVALDVIVRNRPVAR